MSEMGKAVFLSYASQDAAAARRICEALRAAGVEVWFDQSELRGGDAWDAKIRKQIQECALFVPIISVNTQARLEGYFRLEWKLAAQRTHTMAEAKPFLVPVAIDSTRDAEAHVPAEFRALQWTRLGRDQALHEFCTRVQNLLGNEGVPASSSAPATTANWGAESRLHRAHRPRLVATVVAALVISLGLFLWQWGSGSGADTIAPPGSARRVSQPAPARLGPKSIAVLPFENLSEDPDGSAFFAEGMHVDVITNLLAIREVRCVPRATVMTYRGTKKSVREVAYELGVAYVLTGTVQRAEHRVRITGTLIDARTDESVWSKPYNKDLTKVGAIFDLQSELAHAIASELRAALSPQEKVRLDRHPTDTLAAYDLFLKARAVQNALADSENNTRQIGLLEEAVRLDPNFASAWSALSSSCANNYFLGTRSTVLRTRSREAVDTALRLAPDSADTIHALGNYFYRVARDYPRATEQYETLARLQPNNPAAYHDRGVMERRQGKVANAVTHLRKALELDPRNMRVLEDLGSTYWWFRRYRDAMETYHRIKELTVGNEQLTVAFDLASLAFFAEGTTRSMDDWIARLSLQQMDAPLTRSLHKEWAQIRGDHAEAVRLDRLQPYGPEGRWTRAYQAFNAALSYAAQGDMAAARVRLEDFPGQLRARVEQEPDNHRLWGQLGCMEALLGHSDEALRCARRAVELMPESVDVIWAARVRGQLALVYAWNGDKERALAELATVLRAPSIHSVHQLRHDAGFLSLHEDPRFESLLNDPKNNVPLF